MAPSMLWTLLASISCTSLVRGSLFPYERQFTNKTTPADEHNDIIPDQFADWLIRSLLNRGVPDLSGDRVDTFYVPEGQDIQNVKSIEDLHQFVASHHVEPKRLPKTAWAAVPTDRKSNMSDSEYAQMLFSNLDYELAPECIQKKETYWYRTANGACNWLKKGESHIGSTYQPRSRDFGQHSYADGISKPREGPNPRELSNAFFKRKKRLHYSHTPLMLGLVEWIMHDVSYSADTVNPARVGEPHQIGFEGSNATEEYIDVPIPPGDEAFDPQGYGNRTFRVWRTKAVAGTGTSKENPREHENGATAWLDASALYGSTEDVARALRSFKHGKLKAAVGKDGREYLPFNNGPETLGMRTRPGVNVTSLFMGGDPRTNEDWIMLSVHTLLLREHNRLCGILHSQYPDWDDERLYQTIRLVIGSKVALIGNAYQMAYWSEEMPWPRDDGFPLYRAMYGANPLEINPVHAYPWSVVTRNNRPMVTSAEMSIIYRFHEFIINEFPLKDEHNKTVKDLTVFSTGFDSPGFFNYGADAVLRGMLATDIPNFKSGVDETFRSAGRYRGQPLDLVVWSIVHEREQGVPNFNDYWRAYSAMDPPPAINVKIREKFEDFTSDPEALAALKRLYKTPDEVDFSVGVQLEEELFPGTTMPKSALIPSLFSLFGVGNSDRFSPAFAALRCILVDKPWDCHPSNALEELLWEPRPTDLFPDARWYNSFWVKELDLQVHGTNLLFRLITENSGAKCVQKNPLFPYDPQTNPILCEPGHSKGGISPPLKDLLFLLTPASIIKFLRSPFVSWKDIRFALCLNWRIFFTILAGIVTFVVVQDFTRRYLPHAPAINWGNILVGVGQDLQMNSNDFLSEQQKRFGKGETFGLRLFGSILYFIAGNDADIDSMKHDELRASAHDLSDDVQLGSVVGRHNFKEELHAVLIRRWLKDRRHITLPTLSRTVNNAVRAWLNKTSLVGKNIDSLQDPLLDLMTHVMSASVSGIDGHDDPELIAAYKGLSKASVTVFGTSNLLPHWLAVVFSTFMTWPHWRKIKRVLKPIIAARRAQTDQEDRAAKEHVRDLLTMFVDSTDDDERVAELVGGIVIGGLINMASALHNALYDTISAPASQRLKPRAIDTATFWHTPLPVKAAVFESLRLSACIFGPVRKIIVSGFKLESDRTKELPKNSCLAASPYLVHHDKDNYTNPLRYDPSRFATTDPPMGTSKYLTFGLPGHTCPGRFFAVETTSIALNELLTRYEFRPVRAKVGHEGYHYRVGDVVMVRKPFALNIRLRKRSK